MPKFSELGQSLHATKLSFVFWPVILFMCWGSRNRENYVRGSIMGEGGGEEDCEILI